MKMFSAILLLDADPGMKIQRKIRRRRNACWLRKKTSMSTAWVIVAIADQLAPLCKTLTIPKSPSLIKTQTLWHLATQIQGKLKDPEPRYL